MRVSRATRLICVVGGAATLLLAACGGDDGPYLSDGELKVCSDTPYEPFEFKDDSGKDVGFDMDLMREVADRLDRKLVVSDQLFDTIFTAPKAGKCDIVASAATINDERKKSVLFTDPYFDADQSLLVRTEDEDTYASLDDLADQTIGVQQGTTGADYANENGPDGATIKEYQDADGLFLALESGEIAAILQDLPVNAYRATQESDFVVTDTFPTGEQYGFAAEKDNKELIDDVNEQLKAMHDDGTYDEIYAKYFGEAPS